MDTPTVFPCLIFIESDTADNENWIGEGGGNDPENITFSNFTEGTHCVVLYNIKRFATGGIQGNKATHNASGNTYEERQGKRFYNFTATGHTTDFSQLNYFNTFHMLERHTEINSPFKPIYMVYKKASDTYMKFVDEGGNLREYLKCNVDFAITFNGMSKTGMKLEIVAKVVSTW